MSIPLQKQNRVYGDILEVIDFLRKEGFVDIRLLCHDHRDIPFAASFSGIDYVYTGDVYTYLAVLRSCDLSITYRLHSALPCLSYGTPMINISYDERALSMIQTIGFGDWNIDMIQSDDVVQQIIDRYHRLKELPRMREREQPLWDKLYSVMDDTFQSFAADVHAYRATLPK
jgi:polysaccharide pyruvyl transferase WcaK-like protein